MSTTPPSQAPQADTANSSRNAPVIELTARDIHQYGGVYCPSPKAGMKIWNNHPRVFIDITHQSQGRCPYCGTVYRLKEGEHLKGGH